MKKKAVVKMLAMCTVASTAMTNTMVYAAEPAVYVTNQRFVTGKALQGFTLVEENAEAGNVKEESAPAAVSEPQETESHDEQTHEVAPAAETQTTVSQNEDGSVTKVTTSTTEETETETSTETVKTEIHEGDLEYDMIQKHENGDPVLDEDGNEIHPTSKTEVITTTTTTVTPTTTVETETTSKSWTTNAEDYSEKNVATLAGDATVTEADANVKEAAQNFLNSQNVTADYAVYADRLENSIDHIDGNIAVDTLGCSETIMNKEQYGNQAGTGEKDVVLAYAQNGYSYVGSVDDGVQIRTNSCNQTVDGKAPSLLVHGSDANKGMKNEWGNIEENGTANHFVKVEVTDDMLDEDGKLTEDAAKTLVESDARLEDLAEVMDIDNNRQAIAEAGQALIDATNTSNGMTDLQKVQETAKIIDSNMVTKDQVVTVTVGIDTLRSYNDWNEMNEALNKLVTDNSSEATVVVNVVTGSDDLNIGINYQMDRTGQYNCRAANLFWNFGTYNGTLTFNSGWSGSIIAPLANVILGNGIQTGRVTAATVSTRGEIHMAVSPSSEHTVTNTSTVTGAPKVTTESSTELTLHYPERENPHNPSSTGHEGETDPKQPDGGETPDTGDKEAGIETPTDPNENDDKDKEDPDTETPVDPDGGDKTPDSETPTEPEHEKDKEAPKTETPKEKHEGGNENHDDTLLDSSPETAVEKHDKVPGVTLSDSSLRGAVCEIRLTGTEPVVPQFVVPSQKEVRLQTLAVNVTNQRFVTGKALKGFTFPEKTVRMGQDRSDVQTGDSSNVILYGGIAMACLGSLLVIMAGKKKREKE